MTMRKELNIQEVHDTFKSFNKVFFAEQHSINNMINDLNAFIYKPLEEQLQDINDPVFEKSLDSYGLQYDAPIVEFISRICRDQFPTEFAPLVQEEQNIWNLDLKFVATFFKKCGVTYDEISKRIKQQPVAQSHHLGTVMARSDGATSNDFEDASRLFAEKIELSKRDKFIEKLAQHF